VEVGGREGKGGGRREGKGGGRREGKGVLDTHISKSAN